VEEWNVCNDIDRILTPEPAELRIAFTARDVNDVAGVGEGIALIHPQPS
jgi:hypothetical protein